MHDGWYCDVTDRFESQELLCYPFAAAADIIVGAYATPTAPALHVMSLFDTLGWSLDPVASQECPHFGGWSMGYGAEFDRPLQ